MMRVFPRWRDLLGLGAYLGPGGATDVQLVGWDFPVGAPLEDLRQAVHAIKADPSYLGALVTTHKIDLYGAARDLFDELDEYAELLGEVSCIVRRQGQLLGWATDPISIGRATAELLGPGYFGRTGGQLLCFGAGGAGRALALYLLWRPDPADRPPVLWMTDRAAERLEGLQSLQVRLQPGAQVNYRQCDRPEDNAAVMADLPPYSLVVNATGLGKDRPGSPITDAVQFPEHGVAWDLNYRGELFFLRQAQAQQSARDLRLEDGWRCFIFGWTSVMEKVFDRRISAQELEMLAEAAASARPAGSLNR